MPFLRLQGRWLGRAGFDVERRACSGEPGRLVLEVMDPQRETD